MYLQLQKVSLLLVTFSSTNKFDVILRPSSQLQYCCYRLPPGQQYQIIQLIMSMILTAIHRYISLAFLHTRSDVFVSLEICPPQTSSFTNTESRVTSNGSRVLASRFQTNPTSGTVARQSSGFAAVTTMFLRKVSQLGVRLRLLVNVAQRDRHGSTHFGYEQVEEEEKTARGD